MKGKEKKKILAFEIKCLRKVLRKRWFDRVQNEEVKIAKVEITLLEKIRDMQRRRPGHFDRMAEDTLPKKMLQGRVRGTRPKDRSMNNWEKAVRGKPNSLFRI